MMERSIVILGSAFLFGFTPVAPMPSSDPAQRLSDQLRQDLPVLIISGDYQAASKRYFDLATASSARPGASEDTCVALARSLENYRKALANDAEVPLREVAANEDDEGMQEIRARFGCTRAQLG